MNCLISPHTSPLSCPSGKFVCLSAEPAWKNVLFCIDSDALLSGHSSRTCTSNKSPLIVGNAHSLTSRIPRLPKSSFSSAFSTPCAQRLLVVAALSTDSGEHPLPPIQGEAVPRPPGKREGFLCFRCCLYIFQAYLVLIKVRN